MLQTSSAKNYSFSTRSEGRPCSRQRLFSLTTNVYYKQGNKVTTFVANKIQK